MRLLCNTLRRNSLSRRKVQPQHTDHWQDEKGVDEFHPPSPTCVGDVPSCRRHSTEGFPSLPIFDGTDHDLSDLFDCSVSSGRSYAQPSLKNSQQQLAKIEKKENQPRIEHRKLTVDEMIDRLLSLLDEPVAVQQESIIPIMIQQEESKAIDHQQQQQDRCNRDEHRVLTPDEINEIVDSLLSLLNKPVHHIP